MNDLVFPNDHEEIAWSHWLAQHVGMPNTESFARSFYPPLNVLDKAEADLYTKRWLETAEGEQLDGIGSIVGLSRTVDHQVYLKFFGFTAQAAGYGFNQYKIRSAREPYSASVILTDHDYRIAIQRKIALNNSHGTAEEIMYAINSKLDITDTVIYDVGNANAMLLINDLTFTSKDPDAEIIDQLIPRAAGVQIWPVVYDIDNTFGFQNQQIYFGFNIGILARSIASNVPPISANPIPPIIPAGPTLDISFMSESIDPRITFTRSSNAWYYNFAGNLQVAGPNVPRFDYDPNTRQLRGLLVEEARTNIALPSVGWMPAQTVSPTLDGAVLNSGITPDATNTAELLIPSGANATHEFFRSYTGAVNTQYTLSVYMKAAGNFNVMLSLSNSAFGANSAIGYFNLSDGTINTGTSSPTAVISNVGNGWYRCSVTATSLATSGSYVANIRIMSNSNAQTYPGDMVSGILVWGKQIEIGAYRTSYIPTTTVNVTRARDICNIPVDNSWYKTTMGSLAFEYILSGADPTKFSYPCSFLGSNINTDWIALASYTTTASNIKALTIGASGIRTAGISQANQVWTIPPAAGSWSVIPGITQKSVMSFGVGNNVLSSNNGVDARFQSGPVTTMPNILNLNFAPAMNSQPQVALYIRRVKYWDRILTQSEVTNESNVFGS